MNHIDVYSIPVFSIFLYFVSMAILHWNVKLFYCFVMSNLSIVLFLAIYLKDRQIPTFRPETYKVTGLDKTECMTPKHATTTPAARGYSHPPTNPHYFKESSEI